MLRALGGDGAGLAGQILSAVDDMTEPQCAGAIGEVLAETADLSGFKTHIVGSLWLRDLEITAWRVLFADRQQTGPAEREAFHDVWKNI